MSRKKLELPPPTMWDRVVSWFSPEASLRRLKARVTEQVVRRSYEAAHPGHRTAGWNRNRGDMNSLTKFAGAEIRMHTRDLLRNNSWARRGARRIANRTVRTGIVAKPISADAKLNAKAAEAWKAWANSTACDASGRHNFYGLQRSVMKAVVADGEVLVRRRSRRPEDGLPLPMQLQVIEIDCLDTQKDEEKSLAGGKIIQGVEFDLLGKRAAYWVFPEHPGSSTRVGVESQRIPARDVSHVFYEERPGQVRGIGWYAPTILNLKDFDEWEDGELMKQKVAAAFAAFIVDINGESDAANEEDEDDETLEHLEPGLMKQLEPGQDIRFSNPPQTAVDSFPTRQLRRIAAGIGITYESLTGDYSNVNFSSGKLGQLAENENVEDWQWDMMIPQFCDPAFAWAMEAASLAGLIGTEFPAAEWTVPPVPMIDPEKEGLAAIRRVRGGLATFSEIVREQGHDPDTFFAEYEADKRRLDASGIVLDSDVEKVSQAGLTQVRVGVGSAGGKPASGDPPAKGEQAEFIVATLEAIALSKASGPEKAQLARKLLSTYAKE